MIKFQTYIFELLNFEVLLLLFELICDNKTI